MQAIRGTPEDFDTWEAMGCSGWGAAEVLPYFKRFETDLDFADSETHGADGPFPIQRLPLSVCCMFPSVTHFRVQTDKFSLAKQDRTKWGPVDSAFYEAAVSMGWAEVPDHNSFDRYKSSFARRKPCCCWHLLVLGQNSRGAELCRRARVCRSDSTGVSPFARNDILDPTKTYEGVGRVSVYDSFIEPIRGDQSRELEILTNAHVHRVVFEGTRAVGVMVSYGGPGGSPELLRADDIILCAGTITPPSF